MSRQMPLEFTTSAASVRQVPPCVGGGRPGCYMRCYTRVGSSATSWVNLLEHVQRVQLPGKPGLSRALAPAGGEAHDSLRGIDHEHPAEPLADHPFPALGVVR